MNIIRPILSGVSWFVGGGIIFTNIYDYIGNIHTVRGLSMSPTLNPGPDMSRFKEKVWIHKLEVNLKRYKPQIGDVIVFKSPKHGSRLAIKRVAGVEKDYVVPSKGQRKASVIQKDHVWVEADNYLTVGRDSNEYGPLHTGLIVGKVNYIVWPWGRIGKIPNTPPPRTNIALRDLPKDMKEIELELQELDSY